MNYLLEVSDAADKEIEVAFFWYEAEQENSGLRFLAHLDETIALITDFPYSYPQKNPKLQGVLYGDFPLCYIISNNLCYIISNKR